MECFQGSETAEKKLRRQKINNKSTSSVDPSYQHLKSRRRGNTQPIVLKLKVRIKNYMLRTRQNWKWRNIIIPFRYPHVCTNTFFWRVSHFFRCQTPGTRPRFEPRTTSRSCTMVQDLVGTLRVPCAYGSSEMLLPISQIRTSTPKIGWAEKSEQNTTRYLVSSSRPLNQKKCLLFWRLFLQKD